MPKRRAIMSSLAIDELRLFVAISCWLLSYFMKAMVEQINHASETLILKLMNGFMLCACCIRNYDLFVIYFVGPRLTLSWAFSRGWDWSVILVLSLSRTSLRTTGSVYVPFTFGSLARALGKTASPDASRGNLYSRRWTLAFERLLVELVACCNASWSVWAPLTPFSSSSSSEMRHVAGLDLIPHLSTRLRCRSDSCELTSLDSCSSCISL